MTINPDEPDRKLGKPIEEMARALLHAKGAERSAGELWPDVLETYRAMCRSHPQYADGHNLIADVMREAKAALTVLRRHGWITSDCIDAIHAEEDDNGEARSSIIGGGK